MIKSSALLQAFTAICFAAGASAVSAQNAIQLFAPVDVRSSAQGTGDGADAVIFNSTTLDLTCTAPITATISSTPDGTGNVLVDNFITFSTGGTPVDICSQGIANGNQQNCFTSGYTALASPGGLIGQDPDNYTAIGGVPPIDVSAMLSPGAVQATIGLVDTDYGPKGFDLASSSLYLVTSCTPNGVAGPGKVSGNPISSSNPTGAQLTQNYSFNSNSNQQVQFTYDLSQAQQSGHLFITDGTIPSTLDMPLDPSAFQGTYLHDTSFATSSCLLHTGELYNNAPACKLYTLTCQVGTDPKQAGALCPTSTQANEIFQEAFDGPSFNLPDITGPTGTFHQGVGFLEAQDNWGGGPCKFDQTTSLANTDCPLNVLTNFSGPGLYRSAGSGQNPNSSFITVAPVPEDLTTVSISGQKPGYWVNNQNVVIDFVSTPPSVPGTTTFVPSPIATLTYGITPASSVPQPGLPNPNDTVIPNPIGCPAPGGGNTPAATVFTPGTQTKSVMSDGNYVLHYLAQDCAGTQELKFTQTGGSWSTSFYSTPINVDTVAPLVAVGPTLSPAPSSGGTYYVGESVTATYQCTDDRSGIATCGAYTYATPPLATPVLMSKVDTSQPGPQTFTVNAVDAAGNPTSASVQYQVVASAPVNMYLLKLAAARVKSNTQLTYAITAINLSKNAASSVAITDPLPVGVTFVNAAAQQIVCAKGKCSNQASCGFANNTVSCTTSSLTVTTPILVEITVKVNALAGTKIKNTATVTSSNPDTTPANTQSSATTTVY